MSLIGYARVSTTEGRQVAAWGKFESPADFHRLEHHCADVAACFETMLRDPVLRARLERASDGARLRPAIESRLAVIVFLHDFAKLNTGFQFKVLEAGAARGARRPRAAGHIGEALWAFEHEPVCDALGLRDKVDDWGEGFATLLLAALAHHGRPARRPSRAGSGPPELWAPFDGYDPLATARLLEERCRAWFPSAFAANAPALPNTPALAHLFAGLVSLADQIGSDREFFPFEPGPDPDYIHRARARARCAVREKGFQRADRPSRAPPADFARLFGYAQPRPLQHAAAGARLDGARYAAWSNWRGEVFHAGANASHGRYRAQSILDNPVAGGGLGSEFDLTQDHVQLGAGARLTWSGVQAAPSLSVFSGALRRDAHTAEGAVFRADVPGFSQRYSGWKSEITVSPKQWLPGPGTLRWRPALHLHTQRTHTAGPASLELAQHDKTGVLSLTSSAVVSGLPGTVHGFSATVDALRSDAWQMQLGFAGMQADGDYKQMMLARLRVHF